MFKRVLIANRGEIACRIMRTCRRLGIETVAVFSTADQSARHVRMADRAIPLDGAAPGGGYLDQERVLQAAADSGAEAVHPGYGFLAENTEFAAACAAAGVTFVGPPAKVIRAMGLKHEAKRLMEDAEVPCVPGYQGDDLSPERLAVEAERVGFPLLVKATAGGGGKGMRVVRSAVELEAAVEAARGEARRAFGDDRILLERYLERPRHIEAQILADAHGHAIFLFERECTLQRRHQKVIEEAPSPAFDAHDRADFGVLALRAAAAIGYVNAGTVEFLYSDGQAYFIEMNTRLQVEHPVTEMVTGLDLVEWQLRIAAGERLGVTQSSLRLDGHAIEARLYAEDPAHGFVPSVGTLHDVRWPDASDVLRVETGIDKGDLVGLDYDPMLAKIVAWGHDRDAALGRLERALEATRIGGVVTNRGYLLALLADPLVRTNAIDTAYLERVDQPVDPRLERDALHLAVADRLLEREARAAQMAAAAGDPYSPWQAIDGFRLGAPAPQTIRLAHDGDGASEMETTVEAAAGGWRLVLEGEAEDLQIVDREDGDLTIAVGGRRIQGRVVHDGERRWVGLGRGDVILRRVAAVASGADETAADGLLRAPMPGRVIEVAVDVGATVSRGDLLLKLEAMKMEHRVLAEVDGRVVDLAVAAGDQVAAGAPLVVIDAAGALS